jgi:hypothetical protein
MSLLLVMAPGFLPVLRSSRLRLFQAVANESDSFFHAFERRNDGGHLFHQVSPDEISHHW